MSTSCKSTVQQIPATSPQLLGKRLTDIAISLLAIIFLTPLIVILFIIIKIDSPGPIFFRQRRVGRDGTFFKIFKFRTMFAGTPDLPTDEMLKLSYSPVTRAGKFLRATSLDELPQLINVLKGEMSLVGPRPALYNQIELTNKRKACGVLEFLPGVTGLAQVSGRDELPDEVKVSFDKWYCEHWNYWLDWSIVLATFKAIASRRGVN